VCVVCGVFVVFLMCVFYFCGVLNFVCGFCNVCVV